ncbi:MAG: HAMP domain-containing histidine kinase [Methylotenera sp.]|nr:HAMP domain-containing histidine kinase [Oligoflexia bacterium]
MTTPASEVLKSECKTIMERWEKRAREEVASTYGIASLSMRDSLPKHLDQLAKALAKAGKESTTEIANTTLHKEHVGKEHGSDRANTTGYSIEEVIFEYRILRQVIIQTLEEKVSLSAKEREIITDLIEQAVNDAAVEFSSILRDTREQFTATLTHDLRGPISAAQTSAELIRRQPGSSDACLKNAERIIESMKRMDSMIQNLLDAGRIQAGQGLPVDISYCRPAEIALHVIEEMTEVYGKRFELLGSSNLHTWWSSDLVRRALENLVSNAVKYGDVQACITVTVIDTDRHVKMTVHNEGNVILKDEMATLFQKYRRSKSAETSSIQGWGLGLTLVSGAAQAHGGTIEVESSQKKGTIFTLTLPKDCRLATISRGS